MRRWLLSLFTLGLLALAGAVPAVALADLSAPWNGQPVSIGLGPTYGESWPYQFRQTKPWPTFKVHHMTRLRWL
jgi:hypothetical protein